LIVLSLGILEIARQGVGPRPFFVGQTPVAKYAQPGTDGPVVIIAHGFAGSQQMMQGYALPLAQTGYRVFVFDFLGHGRNPVPMSGDTITARARWLVRNNGYAANAVESFASNVVGDGIKPSSSIADAKKKEELQALWLAWTDDADAEGLTDFYGLQRRAAREVFLSGEVFLRIRPRRVEDGLTVPLQLQMLPAEMLPLDMNRSLSGAGMIRQGIEFDGIGRRVAYHFLRRHPGDMTDPGLGKPLIVRSAYRSPEHNRAVGGAPASKHMQGTAFDIAMANHDPAAFEAAARAVGFLGFGYYPRSGFMHIDLGPARSWGDPFPTRPVPFAPEQPPAREVLSESRTLRGGGAAGAATVGAAGVEVLQEVLAETQSTIQPLVPYLDSLRWVLIGIALIGIAVTIHARLDDWKRGQR